MPWMRNELSYGILKVRSPNYLRILSFPRVEFTLGHSRSLWILKVHDPNCSLRSFGIIFGNWNFSHGVSQHLLVIPSPCFTTDGRLQNLHMTHRAQLRKTCPVTQTHLEVPVQSLILQKTKVSVEKFEDFLDVRSVVSHLHVNRLQHSVKQYNLSACSSNRALVLTNPIPS